MKFAILTLGCKLNQYDSASVAGRLSRARLKPAPAEEADLLLLNTCTVTHRADKEAQRLLRTLRRDNPRATIAVMGCSTRLSPELFHAMPEVDAVLPTGADVDAFLRDLAPEGARRAHACVPHFGGRTRALLKVQEGCSFPCTYCVIPAVRGPSRSVPPEDLVEDLRALLEAGHREVVLTGVNTGEYGRDLGLKGGLASLVERLLSVEGEYRLRLNSVEPRAVTPALRALMRGERRLARHLQIPLQSGSDAVLRRMRRNYRSAFYADLVARLAQEVPGVGIGADVLVGFPTETDGDFRATLDLLESSPIAFVHAFSYSARPGTPAASLPALPASEVARRAAAVRALGHRKSAGFADALLGLELPALTLAPCGEEGRALTDNFLDVRLDAFRPANEFVTVRLISLRGAGVRGVVAV